MHIYIYMFMQLYHMFVVASNQTRAHLPTRCPFFEQINIIKHHHLVGMLCPKSVTWLQPSENSWESFKKKERSNFPGFRIQILSAFPQRCNRGEHMWMILHGCVTSSHTPCLTVPTRYLWSNVQGIRVFHDRFQARIDPHSFENSEAKDGDKNTHSSWIKDPNSGQFSIKNGHGSSVFHCATTLTKKNTVTQWDLNEAPPNSVPVHGQWPERMCIWYAETCAPVLFTIICLTIDQCLCVCV